MAKEKKNKKEKKENKVVKSFKLYNFIFKVFIFAMLLTLAILMLVYKDAASGAIFLITGVVVAFSALFRIVPLIRTLKTKRSKLINLIEIIGHLVIGTYLIFAAFYHWGFETPEEIEASKLAALNLELYRYILVVVFYTRALVYYWTTILYKEETTKIMFWLHTVLMTLAIVFGFIKFSPNTIVYAVIILAFVCALVVAAEAGTGFYRYRKEISKSKKPEKEIPTTDELPKEAPQDETNKDKNIKDEPNDNDTINEIDPSIIPVDDNQRDTPIVS